MVWGKFATLMCKGTEVGLPEERYMKLSERERLGYGGEFGANR